MKLTDVFKLAIPLADKHSKARIETETTRLYRARKLFVHWGLPVFKAWQLAPVLGVHRTAIYYYYRRTLDRQEKELLRELKKIADARKVWWNGDTAARGK